MKPLWHDHPLFVWALAFGSAAIAWLAYRNPRTVEQLFMVLAGFSMAALMFISACFFLLAIVQTAIFLSDRRARRKSKHLDR
jgi:uncharacterized protein YybS (DUF2232 family)